MAQPAETAPSATRRSWLPRLTLFLAILGACLTATHALFLAAYDPLGATLGMPAAAYHQVVVPLLALAAVTGALILERQPLGGMFLLLAAMLVGWSGGAAYLLPAVALGCFSAQRRSAAARAALGFILMIPGVVTVYYGLAALLSYASGQAMPGMPPALDPPASPRQAALPLLFLPVALLGAWLLTDRPPQKRGQT